MSVIKNSRVTLDQDGLATAEALIAQYRAAKASARIADDLAKAAHAALAEILGEAEYAVTPEGVQVVRMPERTRRTLPVEAALELAPILAPLVNVTTYRVVA